MSPTFPYKKKTKTKTKTNNASNVAQQVAEQKYESIKSVNVALESAILQLRHQVEIGRSRQSRRRQIAQMTEPSSAGAAQSSTGPGFSASPGSPPSFSSISGSEPPAPAPALLS